MVITEVRIKLMEENNERLHAFCSVTLDDAFVVRDLKIIEGTRGMFVAMPSRKLMDRCGCGCITSAPGSAISAAGVWTRTARRAAPTAERSCTRTSRAIPRSAAIRCRTKSSRRMRKETPR
ncbi:MAG: SpoVG family protein [Gemmataceae bacterium]